MQATDQRAVGGQLVVFIIFADCLHFSLRDHLGVAAEEEHQRIGQVSTRVERTRLNWIAPRRKTGLIGKHENSANLNGLRERRPSSKATDPVRPRSNISDMHLFDKGGMHCATKSLPIRNDWSHPAGCEVNPLARQLLKQRDSLSYVEKKLYSRQADVYAAYLAYTDHEIWRVIQAVEDLGKLDNTLIIYIEALISEYPSTASKQPAITEGSDVARSNVESSRPAPRRAAVAPPP
jgi:hypothetical protein